MKGDPEGSPAPACSGPALLMQQADASEAVLPALAAHVAALLGVRSAGIVLEDGDSPIVVACATDELVATLVAVEHDLGQGPTLKALAHGSPVRVDNLDDAGSTWPLWTAEARTRGVGAWLAAPSRSAGPSAVVCACSSRTHRWQEADVSTGQVLADLATAWVAHARELEQLRRDAARLQEALDHRLVIEQAKGIIAGELACSLDQAFAIIRDHARRNNATVRSVARAVVELGLRPPAPHGHGGVT